MIRRSQSRSILLAALLCSACAPDTPQAPAAPEPEPTVTAVPRSPAPTAAATLPMPAAAPDLLGWWDRPEALDSLGLTLAEGTALATELSKLERSYQIAQRQLRTIRHTQLEMLHDARVPGADIRRFNRENLQKLLASMGDDDIAARLWVRQQLSTDRQALVLKRSPEFFGVPWFRAANG